MRKKNNSIKKKVAVLVYNSCKFDNRVIKTTEAIAKQLNDIIVFATNDPNSLDIEKINGILYFRKGIVKNYFLNSDEILLEVKPLRILLPLIRFGLNLPEYLNKIFYEYPKVIAENLLKIIKEIPREFAKKIPNNLLKIIKKITRKFAKKIPNNLLKIIKKISYKYPKVIAENLLKIIKKISYKYPKVIAKNLLKIIFGIFLMIFNSPKRQVYLKKLINFSFIKRKLYKSYKFSLNLIIYNIKVLDCLIKNKIDIVHAHDLFTLPVAGIYSLLFKKKFIYDSHELETHRNAKFSLVFNFVRNTAESFFIKKAYSVITVSESISDYLYNFYKLKYKPIVTFNSPKIVNNKSLKNLRSDLSIPDSTRILVYVGLITKNRGLEQVMLAIKKIPNMVFVTVGPCNNLKNLEKLKEIREENNLINKVFFLDPVSHSELISYISSADASIIPLLNVCLSYYYCMPNKLFESTFAGLPLIVNKLKDLNDFVSKYGRGLSVDMNNPLDLSKKIEEVLSNKNKYKLNQKLFSLIKAKYSWEVQEAKIIKLYKEIC